MTYPKVYIILLNYNNWYDTIECLESVLRNDYPNYQVIVIDNNSPNNSIEYLKAWAEGKIDIWVDPRNPLRKLSFPPVPKPIPYVYYTREEAEKGGNLDLEKKLESEVPEGITTKYPIVFIQSGSNLGFAGGNNVGIRYALARDDFDYIWLLNNDTVIDETSLSKMVYTLSQNNNDVGIVGSKILYYAKPSIIQGCGIYENFSWYKAHYKMIARNLKDNEKFYTNFHVSSIYGASFIVKKVVLNDIGFLDESFFLQREETEFCYRAISHGYKILCCGSSKVWHKEGASKNNKKLFYYYNLRNSLLFAKKYFKGFKLLFYISIPYIYLFIRSLLIIIIKENNKFEKIITCFQAFKDGISYKIKRKKHERNS